MEPLGATLGDALQARGDLQKKWSLGEFAGIAAGFDPQLKQVAAMSFLGAVYEAAATQTPEPSTSLGLDTSFRLSRDTTNVDVEDALLERIEKALGIAHP